MQLCAQDELVLGEQKGKIGLGNAYDLGALSLHLEKQPQSSPASRKETLHRSLWRRVHSSAEIHTVLSVSDNLSIFGKEDADRSFFRKSENSLSL